MVDFLCIINFFQYMAQPPGQMNGQNMMNPPTQMGPPPPLQMGQNHAPSQPGLPHLPPQQPAYPGMTHQFGNMGMNNESGGLLFLSTIFYRRATHLLPSHIRPVLIFYKHHN